MNRYEQDIKKVQVLSSEETTNLIAQMKAGSETARNKLITHNMKLVLSLANKYIYSIDLPMEDLIDIGCFGLVNAIDSYDETKKVKLSTFAYFCINNEYRRYIYLSRMQKRRDNNLVSINSIIYKSDDGGITLEDTIAFDELSLEELVELKIRDEKLKKAMATLKEDEQLILILRYGFAAGENHTLKEIGNRLGVTDECIRLRNDKILKKLKQFNILDK